MSDSNKRSGGSKAAKKQSADPKRVERKARSHTDKKPTAQPENDAKQASVKKKAPKHDPEVLANFAWKIYLAEISEEGVALVDDKGAKELAKRCFALASIFLDEKAKQG